MLQFHPPKTLPSARPRTCVCYLATQSLWSLMWMPRARASSAFDLRAIERKQSKMSSQQAVGLPSYCHVMRVR